MLSWHVAVRLRKDQIQWDWCANTPPSPFLYQVHVEIGVQFIIHVMHTGVATFMIYSAILISKSIMSLDESMRPQIEPASRSPAEFSHNLICPLWMLWFNSNGWLVKSSWLRIFQVASGRFRLGGCFRCLISPGSCTEHFVPGPVSQPVSSWIGESRRSIWRGLVYWHLVHLILQQTQIPFEEVSHS